MLNKLTNDIFIISTNVTYLKKYPKNYFNTYLRILYMFICRNFMMHSYIAERITYHNSNLNRTCRLYAEYMLRKSLLAFHLCPHDHTELQKKLSMC